MRPQTRPFMVEVKSRHSRGRSDNSVFSQRAIPTARLEAEPERPKSGPTLAEANRLFSGLVSGSVSRDPSLREATSVAVGPSRSSQATPTGVAAQPRRVLPSLGHTKQESVEDRPVGPAQQPCTAKRPVRKTRPV